jgi:phosphatidylserine/phosphatidylglycerophosphate/cardiolipin synthase-like enzyme
MMLAALLLQFAPRAAPQPEALPSSVEHIEQLVERSTDAPLYRHNAVRLLLDGPQTFSAMLEAIEAARHHVHLETYIFGADAVGERFAAALIAAARRSVDVRVIYDALGSREAPSERRPSSAGPGLPRTPPPWSARTVNSATRSSTRRPAAWPSC